MMLLQGLTHKQPTNMSEFKISKSGIEDLDSIMDTYRQAVRFMRINGNTQQWTGGYPSRERIMEDIDMGNHYMIIDSQGKLSGVFVLISDIEPTYLEIEGEWLNDHPYATLHRVASTGIHPQMLEKCVDYAMKHIDNVRIDTHADNLPMQRSIERVGFTKCGIIHLADGSPRIAYQKLNRN